MMLNSVPDGTRLYSSHKIEYRTMRFIASGGQGEVYEVEDMKTGSRYALKWYYKHSATAYQRKRIDDLVKRGAPDAKFLWPLDLAEKNNLFGYVMKIRPPHYKSVVDLMKRRADPSFASLCMAGINLADGYQSLHSQGLCYRDISFGNLFFDPANGDVLICDNDNVTVNKDSESATNGTPRFIAPEIIKKKGFPSTETDLYSMAVLLFYMFMLHHPLEGAAEAGIKCFDGKAMERIYGQNPVFIWDPRDKSNRPVPGYQENAIIFWKIYPKYLRDLFTRSFTAGLRDVNARIVEKQWKDVFARLRDEILFCQSCGRENFYEPSRACWSCGNEINLPPRVEIGAKRVMLNHDSKIFAHHVKNNFDFHTEVGRVSRHPTDARKWGLSNTGSENWIYCNSSGENKIIEPGKTAPLASGARINFGPAEGIIN